MRNAYCQTDVQFDRLFHILDTPLPSSPMTDPQYFLNENAEALMHGLDESRREQRRVAVGRFSVAFGVFTAIAMLFSFSREARAFARDVLYSVIEWFSPQQNESGVTFNIQGREHSTAPDASVLTSDSEKVSFNELTEAEKQYNCSIFVLSGDAFTLSDGFIQNEILCMNYQSGDSRVQLIEEPIQQSGSINYHFNDSNFEKADVPGLGTFYYDLSESRLFGGILTNDTSITISAKHASSDLLDQIVCSISRYR